jgi:aminopeptidase YwaD
MHLDWHTIDRWLMGEAWVGSQIETHLAELCDNIGPRWASSAGEWRAVNYIRDHFAAAGLHNAALEEYELATWACDSAAAHAGEEERPIPILPFHRCPPLHLRAPLVDAGFGTAREIDEARTLLPGAVAVIALVYEPFTPPMPLTDRLQALATAGAAAAVVVDRKDGGRMEYHIGSEWRDPTLDDPPLPAVTVSREDGVCLRKLARQGQRITLTVESRFYHAPSHNVAAELAGTTWPDEHLLLGGHHDTVYGAPGGNDNASGTIVVMETARMLAGLQAALGVRPGRAIRFVTFSAEEQKLQGAYAYAARHYGPQPGGSRTTPRLAINLDELATGAIKGLVLAFPHLRTLVQRQFDEMGDGLKAHVMAQLDASSDHFPFLRAGIDAAFLWRWRFVGRHPDSDFHHEAGDTSDKVRPRELKEYVGQLARLLLRLSHVPPQDWPHNPITLSQVQERLDQERGQVIRVY